MGTHSGTRNGSVSPTGSAAESHSAPCQPIAELVSQTTVLCSGVPVTISFSSTVNEPTSSPHHGPQGVVSLSYITRMRT